MGSCSSWNECRASACSTSSPNSPVGWASIIDPSSPSLWICRPLLADRPCLAKLSSVLVCVGVIPALSAWRAGHPLLVVPPSRYWLVLYFRKHTPRQTDRQTDRRRDRQSARQTDQQTD
eukprot:179174-Rhodomonas_salina.1